MSARQLVSAGATTGGPVSGLAHPIRALHLAAPLKDLGEQGRYRRFDRKFISDREDNLDIGWLRDESGGESKGLQDPGILAREAMQELEGAIEEIRGILIELGEPNDEDGQVAA